MALSLSVALAMWNVSMTRAAHSNDLKDMYRSWCICIWSCAIFGTINILLHAIFVLKYWVLSKKIEQLLQNKDDYAGLKRQTYTIVALLTVSTVGYVIYTVYNYTQFPKFKPYARVLFALIPLIPPLILVWALVDALYRMKGSGGAKYSLSTNQVIL
jgi:hypothetical protein